MKNIDRYESHSVGLRLLPPYAAFSALAAVLLICGCSAVAQFQTCTRDEDCGADVNVCWLSVCRAGLCDSEFTDADCNDFQDCTVNDHCEGGRCVGDSICPADQVCIEDDCEPAP